MTDTVALGVGGSMEGKDDKAGKVGKAGILRIAIEYVGVPEAATVVLGVTCVEAVTDGEATREMLGETVADVVGDGEVVPPD